MWVAPEIYEQVLQLPAGDLHTAELVCLTAISAFIGVLCVGTLRRWRWAFWLIMVALLFGVLRVPASILAVAGVLPATGPNWYVLFQGVVGLLQLGIGLAMLASYCRAGAWGSPAHRR